MTEIPAPTIKEPVMEGPTPETILEAYALARKQRDEYLEVINPYLHELEQHMFAVLEANGGSKIVTEDYEFEKSVTYDFHRSQWTPFLEMLTKDEIEHCYTPEVTKMVKTVTPAAFDTTKLKGICKARGGEFHERFEGARYESRVKPNFVDKKAEKAEKAQKQERGA